MRDFPALLASWVLEESIGSRHRVEDLVVEDGLEDFRGVFDGPWRWIHGSVARRLPVCREAGSVVQGVRRSSSSGAPPTHPGRDPEGTYLFFLYVF